MSVIAFAVTLLIERQLKDISNDQIKQYIRCCYPFRSVLSLGFPHLVYGVQIRGIPICALNICLASKVGPLHRLYPGVKFLKFLHYFTFFGKATTVIDIIMVVLYIYTRIFIETISGHCLYFMVHNGKIR